MTDDDSCIPDNYECTATVRMTPCQWLTATSGSLSTEIFLLIPAVVACDSDELGVVHQLTIQIELRLTT